MSESLDAGLHWRHATAAGQPVLRTMVVCDLADSTALVERLGDRRAAALLRKHDRLTRALIDEHNGREIDKTDGYLLLFERPTQAVSFALAYQRGLRFMSEAEEVEVHARVGIHVGDVVMWENSPEDISRGAKPVEVEGLAKPVAARLAALARPQQILLSGVAASIARRGHEEIAEDCPEAEWRSHGLYRIRGVAEATEVFEVGEPGIADFTIPAQRSVARRILPWWRRPSTISGVSLLLALSIGTLIWVIARQPPKIDFAARDWVVIGNIQNQTGQPDFNKTIDTAIRIGLQQSNYVNVISNAKVQQTLELMKKDDDTDIDKKIGSEVAIRDGARALIIPSIVNSGDGIKISASIIDPTTSKVINTLSAQAETSKNIVPVIDTLVLRLRQNLGESLSQIKTTSLPLAKVTTSNLDALRAYSLATQAAGHADYNLSQDLISHALRLDPTFASAYALQAVNYFSMGQINLAEESIHKALANSDRLSTLEQMKMRAFLAASNEQVTKATAAWKVIADLYPDDAAGANNVGLYYAGYLNDCKSALPYLHHASNLPQPLSMASTYTLGTCQLALGKYHDAIQSLLKSYKNGFRGSFLALADAYVATRQYSKASTLLSSVANDTNTAASLAIRQALVVADQGDLSSAEGKIIHAINTIPEDQGNAHGWALQLDAIGILWAQNKTQSALEICQQGLKKLLHMTKFDRKNSFYDYPTLVASYSRWAARLGDIKLAQEGIELASANNQLRGFPIRSQLVAIARSEIALQEGHPEKAVQIATAADSHPLWELLEIIARAKAATHAADTDAAYRRVLDARSLAFGELYENELGICTRAVQWNLTSLAYAKFLQKSHPALAARQASIFLDDWRLAPKNSAEIREAHAIMQAK
ncbi:hypothetical protein GCM10027285_14980 [Oleiagrimonas citrea]|uniref:Putative peptide modification system cyclase n=1 Tax=Oleiagrimonas citrea TaxID=1665687 RepID=A0A846ZP09_9GAMM|nr:putative peptide modification system cyclase [Oleiagrimonas citrea]NKZ40005.1 putative peptide modification system cyclase [Oleiagrimonas citrea]